MSTAQDEAASAAGRSLARARWGTTALRNAVQTLAERRGELDEALKAELREIAGSPAQDGGT
jgi:hypothetical protein